MKHCINKYYPITYDENSRICRECKYNVEIEHDTDNFMENFIKEINRASRREK